MNITIEALRRICQEHRFTEKLLFVPSYSLGHQMGERLAKGGTSWINLRITTSVGYAEQLLNARIDLSGWHLMDFREAILVVEKIYREGKGGTEAGLYFEGAGEVPGTIAALVGTLNEMRMAGLSAAIFDPGACLSFKKGEELHWLLDAYEGFLAKNRLIDTPGLLSMAIDEWKKEGLPGDRLVLAFSDIPYAPLEKEFIIVVGGHKLIVMPHRIPMSPEMPKRFLIPQEKGAKITAPPSEADIDLLRWLPSPQDAPRPFRDGSVSIFHALGESNEIREAIRRILAKEIPLDDVEIIVTSSNPYLPMLFELTSTHALPATFAGGIPITYTRPGRALSLFLDWQAEDFQDKYLRRLFAGGLLNLESIKIEGERPSALRAAAFLRKAAIGWGAERYSARLEGLRQSYLKLAQDERESEGEEEKAAWFEETAKKVDWLRCFIEEIMVSAAFPGEEGTVETAALFRGAGQFLRKFCRIAGDLDAAAITRIGDILDNLSQAPSFIEPLKEAAGRLKRIIEGLTVAASSPKPGHLHICHYRNGGYSGRPYTFILGLDQNRFPGALLQDPVLLDQEREKLNPGLFLSTECMQENIYYLTKLLASLKGRVTLSFPCRDLREDREIFPSPIILAAYRLIGPDRKADYEALSAFLGEPVGFAPQGQSMPLNDWEWWLSGERAGFGTSSVHRIYPGLMEGDNAEEMRDSEIFTEYDGSIPTFAGVKDPQQGEVHFSASRLECLARCPFGYFLKYELKVEPLEELTRDLAQWLTPRQRGGLLHEVFRRFMEELKEKGGKPVLKEHLGRIEAIALEEASQWRSEVPPASELAYTRELEEIKQTCYIFLADEENRQGVEPQFFELSFGIKGEGEEESVEIKLPKGGSFRLRGVIDRVDRCGDHEYEVWDYKTGSPYGYREEGYLNRGRQLQHALYAEAAEPLLRKLIDSKASVVRAGYFFPSPKGEGLRVVRERLRRHELFEVLEKLFHLLRSGLFPASYDKDSCTYCDYKLACGGAENAVARLLEKLAKDERLLPLERLSHYA